MVMKNYTNQIQSDPEQSSKDKNSISHEEYINFTNTPPYQSQKTKAKIKKKTGNNCFALSLMKNNGNIHLFHLDQKVFVSKLRLIDFDDHFDELLEKGKLKMSKLDKQEISCIPEIAYSQRYYYYSKFDEGIQMDEESEKR